MARPLAGGSALALRFRPVAPGFGTPFRAARRLLARHRRARVAILVALVCAPLLTAGWLWLRHSPLVSVEHVHVSGLSGPQASQIRAALERSAHGMSTLEVSTARLRAAVSGFALVRDLHASANLPHTLRISVSEQPPAAALVVGSTREAVAADGVVLGPAALSRALPTLTLSSAPPPGTRLRGGWPLAALAVLGVAPRPLQRAATRVYEGPRGITVVFRSGLEAYFGDASRARAKWHALVLVLSDERAANATSVDLRVPERPAAGYGSAAGGREGTSGSEASGSEAGAGEAGATHDSGAALVEALRSAGGEASPTSSGESNAGEEHTSTSGSEAASGEPSGANESGSGEGSESSPREGG